jgi:hypothetical protein
MPWFSSNKDDESADDATCEWPPKFQSFEEYKAELDEAVDAHPPFGVWLRMYRNVNHVTTCGSQEAMWGLPVQQLKERYLQSANLKNRTKNAKRAFIEMHLEENKAAYEKDESELQPRLDSYALALDSYKQAISHGYRNIPRPTEPRKTRTLIERDILLGELKQLVEPTVID